MTAAVRLVFFEGFRAFFLFAGIFAVVSGLVWTLWLGAQMTGGFWTEASSDIAPYQWHGHEMIFGYASAALGGFLLTAVPNWTGSRDARAAFVATAVICWLAGRVAVWSAWAPSPWLVATLDLLFLPIIMFKIAMMLVRRPKPQNVMFLGFLAVFWVANLMVHLEWTGVSTDTAETGMRAGLVGLASMIGILGGRVTPAFTKNAMKRADVPEEKWPVSSKPVEKAALGLSIALPLAVLLGLPGLLSGVLALAAGVVHFVRLSGWRIGWTLRQPILLALHLGLAMLASGLVLWGLAGLGLGNEIAALHVLGIGAGGGMTMAVMSRAVLGHTGRPLIADRSLAVAYLLVALAAISRWFGSTLPAEWYYLFVIGSGVLWTLAFALYTISIWPAVTTPRLQRAD